MFQLMKGIIMQLGSNNDEKNKITLQENVAGQYVLPRFLERLCRLKASQTNICTNAITSRTIGAINAPKTPVSISSRIIHVP